MEETINYSWDQNSPELTMEVDFLDEKKQEDKLWQARTGLNYDSLCGAIETMIFMSDKPISLQKIREQIDIELPLRVIYESLDKLQKEYEQKHHGIRLMEVAQGYQFRTKPTYSKFVHELFKINALVLSPAALEVLAMIAYKQPISKTDIDKIRGVDSSHLVRTLMDKRLVRIAGRSEDLGKPTLYATTEEFLDVFNLANLEQLPPEYELQELAKLNTVGDIADIKTIVSHTGEKSKYNFDEIGELDSLSEAIKKIHVETEFTRSLEAEERRKLGGEAEGVRSAFDILEEYILKEESIKQNGEAAQSQLPTSIVDVKIVSLDELLLQDKIFNAPATESDLDIEIDETIIEEEVIEAAPEEEVIDEAQELGDALDAAFDRLMGQKEDNLDEVTKKVVENASDFGIDLNFLQENAQNSEEIENDDAQ
ncbi:MAG: SMC-Scp complex subunit ScpB [Bacteriovoracaceae bacterium]|nr:SMC-Scp complex subunit ScpB [Bacteriovoracaceae bacterium]